MSDVEEQLERLRADYDRVRAEIAKRVVGQDSVVQTALLSLFCGGHCLLEGVPGLGKTLLVRTLGEVLDLDYSRIQFTPDLMPADIIGTRIVVEVEGKGREFQFQPGPIFGQIVLADEVNRATPKTQSALLEAMQEHTVTVGREARKLEEPFLVMATQNPLEMDGTYPLPEAQLDRFLFKVDVPFPTRQELNDIVGRTTAGETEPPRRVIDGPRIIEMQKLIRSVAVAPHVQDFAIRIVLATHPEDSASPQRVKQYVQYGASPRGAQAILLGAKARAALDGRFNVAFGDVRATVKTALRHRILVGFEGDAEGIRPDDLVDEIIATVPEVDAEARAS